MPSTYLAKIPLIGPSEATYRVLKIKAQIIDAIS